MKTIKIFIFLIIIIITANIAYSFQANSSNFKLSTGIVSSGGKIINSSSYKNYITTGLIAGVVNSSTYKNFLGFFYTWLLADDQPCTAANQCKGGFCCSNLCKSSSCPVTTTVTAATTTTTAVTTGGGGFVLLKEEKDYSVSPSNIKIKLVLGESTEETLKIKNTGKPSLNVSLDVEGINEYLSLSDSVIDLKVDEVKEVTLEFIGKKVGSFVGQIIAKADGIKKSIPIILEVVTELVLFDVKLDIPSAYSEVEPGNELRTQITLLNVGSPEKVDVIAAYFIKDLRGNIIHEESETFKVEKQISYPKVFSIHESTEPGSYVAIVEIRYANSFAVSSQLFRVVEKKELVITNIIAKNATLMMFLALILIVVISMLSYKLVCIMKKSRKKKRAKKQM